MNLTTKQRVFIIKKLSTEIYNMNEADGILFLEEYTKQEADDYEKHTEQRRFL